MSFGNSNMDISSYTHNATMATRQFDISNSFWQKSLPYYRDYSDRHFISRPFTFGHETRLVLLVDSTLFAITIVDGTPPVRSIELGILRNLNLNAHTRVYLGYQHGVVISSHDSALLFRYTWPETDSTSPNLQVSPLTSLRSTLAGIDLRPHDIWMTTLAMDEMSGHFIVGLPASYNSHLIQMTSFKYWN